MRPGCKKSIVWDHFDKLANGQVQCKMCKKTLKFFGNTTNLNQHLKRIHPTVISSTLEPEDTSNNIVNQTDVNCATDRSNASNIQVRDVLDIAGPSSSNSDKSKFQPPLKRQKVKQMKLFGAPVEQLKECDVQKIDMALVKMITKDYQPLSIVEDKGFVEFTLLLQPQYKLPSRKKLSCDILPNLYLQEVGKLKAILDAIQNVSITTDIWTSDSNRSYITVTCHFIHQYQFHSHTLSTEEIPGKHTGEHISTVLEKIFCKWNILQKITTIVSDNGSNIKCAIIEFLKKRHHPCVAHTLNLSVNDAINNNPEFQYILKKCKTIVGHFNHSALSCSKLKSVQEQMGFPVLKVKQDVATRWNSSLIMLERLLKLKDALSITMTKIEKAPEFLDASEWAIVEEAISVLKPLEVMTAALSADKYVTLSTVIPLVRGLQYSLNNLKTKSHVCLILRNNLVETVNRRLGLLESSKIVAKAAFLDPRFKKLAFGNESNADSAQKLVTEELSSIVNAKNRLVVQDNIDNANEATNVSVSDPVPIENNEEKFDIWAHFDSKVAKAKSFSTPTSIVTSIIRQYLEMPHFDRKKNPMEFWHKYETTFPELHELAMKYLSIPATSVPSERVFSKSGQLTNLRRNRLSPKHLDEILFLNSI